MATDRPDAANLPGSAGAPVDWRKLHAFGWPGGSVRALLAVAIFAAIWTWLWLRPQDEVPAYLQNLLFIIMGHYFASRATAANAGGAGANAELAGPPPLWLPRGTIRVLLVLGFVAVAAGLIYQHRLWSAAPSGAVGVRLNSGGVTLILVAGFLLGVVLGRLRQWRSRRGRQLPRLVEDLRAAVSLVAAGIMVAMTFGFWSTPRTGPLAELQEFFARYRAEDVLAAVVGYYFGSRS